MEKVFSSMPKASFIVLFIVLALLVGEILILKLKSRKDENLPKVTPESNKNKIFLSLLILVLLIVAIPLTLLLVKQRQEVRKKAAEPTACCKITAKNMCNKALGSFDLFVREFATEAQCDAYLQNPETQSYSCNCDESCTTGPGCDYPTCSGHDKNQSCTGSADSCNSQCGKSLCSTSGSGNFRKEIINPALCGVSTPAPTAPPTTVPTVAPTRAPTAPPTIAPTVPPTTAPTRTPTPTPLTTTPPPPSVISCNQGPCNIGGVSCGSGLTCIHDTWFGHDSWVCRNNDCQIESDCVCKQAVVPPGPTSPPVGGPGQTARPYIPGPIPTPTIQVPVIPVAGIDGPTLTTVFVGALLLIAGLAFAL